MCGGGGWGGIMWVGSGGAGLRRWLSMRAQEKAQVGCRRRARACTQGSWALRVHTIALILPLSTRTHHSALFPGRPIHSPPDRAAGKVAWGRARQAWGSNYAASIAAPIIGPDANGPRSAEVGLAAGGGRGQRGGTPWPHHDAQGVHKAR